MSRVRRARRIRHQTAFNQVVRGIQKRLQIEFKYVTSQYGYGLEKGIAREELVIDFLRKYLPMNLSMGPGIVIAPNGEMSQPQDIVIFDHLNYPTFPLSYNSRMFPREGVLGVIQVKSRLDPDTIKNGIENIASAKRLVVETGDRPFGVLVGYYSDMKSLSVKEKLRERNKTYERPYLALDRLYLLGHYALTYRDKKDYGQLRATEEDTLKGLRTKQDTLLHFYRYLLSALNIPQTRQFKVRAYIEPYLQDSDFASF